MQNTINCLRETLWKPINLFKCQSCYKHAVVVLNRPINLPKNILLPLWEKARVTVTVDGGTDRWMTYLGEAAEDVYSGKAIIYAPTMITGDMDSSSAETREKLERVASKIVVTPDQNNTDYTKALCELARHCESQNIKLNEIYVIVETSGRLDHLIGNINTLHKIPKFFAETQVIAVSGDSMTWLLNPGKHRIIIPEALVRAKSWCGIIPFNGRTDKISSTGLKWNLDNVTMEFGGLISTSNTYEDECTEVTISLCDRVLWTMGIESLLDRKDYL